ncbi:MAG: hypothetical protein WEE51_05170, partial [Pirellulaceae bacterium]
MQPAEPTIPSNLDERRSWTTRERILLAILLLAITLFQLAFRQAGHDWGDDFAHYLAHARNLAEGRPYAETGYLYSDLALGIGPKAYPPIFPAYMAPWVAVGGLDYAFLKIAIVLLFTISLLLMAGLAARYLPAWQVLGLTALLGVSSIFWEMNQQILSEPLFLVFWLAVLWLGESREGISKSLKAGLAVAVLLGILIYLAIGTRTVGVVLLIAVPLDQVLRHRRITFTGCIVPVVVAIGLMGSQKWLFPEVGGGYLEHLSMITPGTILGNLQADVTSFSYFWRNGYSESIRKVAGVLLSLVAIYGFVRLHMKQGTTLTSWAVVGYFALVVLWPVAAWTRVILPLIPLYLLYLLIGLHEIPWPRAYRTAALGLFFCFAMGSQLLWLTTVDLGAPPGPTRPEAAAMFAETKERTPEDAICLFFKPRALALLTGRASVTFPHELTTENLQA